MERNRKRQEMERQTDKHTQTDINWDKDRMRHSITEKHREKPRQR